MSLVDYDASSDSEDEAEENAVQKFETKEEDDANTSSPPPHHRHNQNIIASPSQQPSYVVPSPQMEKLPDASLLFSSASNYNSLHHQTIMTDHSSTVTAAIESRKRASNGSSAPPPRCKVPRGHPLSQSRNIPEMAGVQLIPPQLRGRSNVVTEDISKLFVKKDGQNLPRGN